MKKGCLIAIVIIIGLALIGAIFGGSDEEVQTTTKTETVNEQQEPKETTEKEVKRQKTKWVYQEETDEMTDSKTKYASIVSDNEVDFDFPYQGGSKLTLVIRQSKKYGTDAYIKIDPGQFINNEYSGDNKVNVRFDENSPVKYTMADPTDISQDVLFFRDAKGFIKKCKEAKTIRIEPQFFQEGRRVFTFTTPVALEWE